MGAGDVDETKKTGYFLFLLFLRSFFSLLPNMPISRKIIQQHIPTIIKIKGTGIMTIKFFIYAKNINTYGQ